MTNRAAAFDVLGLGTVAVDDFLYVADYPPADAKTMVLRRDRQCGGNTATALVAAARLSVRCAFAGVLGDDDDSRFVRDTLQREGVNLAHVIHESEARPIRAVVIAEATRNTRTIFFDLENARGADPTRPAADVITATHVLLVDHFGVEGMTRAARLARTAGIPIVADLESDAGPGFAELLGLVDHLILSDTFAARLTGQTDPVAAVQALWTNARQLVAVTCGAAGCWFRITGERETAHHQPAFPINAVDTTGCGDVFHGAYAAALAWGWELPRSIQFAAAAAALKATRGGGQAGCPTLAQVEAFLARQP